MKRRLIVLRHAKAERGSTTDHDRALTGRGRNDALAAGRWLAESKLTPDLTVCSTAARAKETWALAAVELEDGIATSLDRRVYHAEPDELLAILRDTPEEVRTLLLVGHNPGLQLLVLALAGDGPDDLLRGAREHLATAGLAVIDLPTDWARLDEGQGTLVEYAVARG